MGSKYLFHAQIPELYIHIKEVLRSIIILHRITEINSKSFLLHYLESRYHWNLWKRARGFQVFISCTNSGIVYIYQRGLKINHSSASYPRDESSILKINHSSASYPRNKLRKFNIDIMTKTDKNSFKSLKLSYYHK